LALATGQGIEFRPAQILRNQTVQALLIGRRGKCLHQRYLLPEGALAHRGNALLETGKCLWVSNTAILATEAVQVAKDFVVKNTDQSVEFEQGVLQGCGGQQYLFCRRQGVLESFGYLVGFFIDVSEPVSFIDDRQIPRHHPQIICLRTGKLVGADHQSFTDIKGIPDTCFFGLVIACGFQNLAFDAKLLLQLLVPLFSQVGGHDD